MAGGGAWQSVQIDSRPVDITSLPEKSVLDEEPVLNHGLAAALELATKKGILKDFSKFWREETTDRTLLMI